MINRYYGSVIALEKLQKLALFKKFIDSTIYINLIYEQFHHSSTTRSKRWVF